MKTNRTIAISTILILGIVLLALIANFSSRKVTGDNYDNTTVITRLNVTNIGPVIWGMTLNKEGTTGNIVLAQGTTVKVRCNGTVYDLNGVADIASVNATIFEQGYDGGNDNNFRYSNASCKKIKDINVTDSLYSCRFLVTFFANNGTWTCNMTAKDTGDILNASDIDKDIDPIYAINVNPLEIDYGELAPNEVSTNQLINVSNYGNMNLSIGVKGYGVTDGDNLAMDCQVGTIPVAREKYALSAATAYGSMTVLGGTFGNIAGLSVIQRTDDADSDNSKTTNTTYWKISPPAGTRGICNGSIVLSAVG